MEEAGPSAGNFRHNQTIVHAAGAFGEDSSDLALSAGQKRKGRRERNLGFIKGDDEDAEPKLIKRRRTSHTQD